MKFHALLKKCLYILTAAILTLVLSFDILNVQPLHVLVFSKTDGFRHASIEAGKTALSKMSKERGFEVDFTEDAAQFTTANLKKYNAVLFLNTTGDVLNDAQQIATRAVAHFELCGQVGSAPMRINIRTINSNVETVISTPLRLYS